MYALKLQPAPTDYASKMIARERYRKAQTVGRSKIDTWIQNWERALKEAQQNKIGEVQDEINPTYDFLGAVESVVPGFSSHWREKISDWKRKGKKEKIPDGFQIAQYFRDSWRAQAATQLSKGTSAPATFWGTQSPPTPTPEGKNTPTLQGQKPPSEREKKCLCGTVRTEEHHWKTCEYVRHEMLGERYPNGFKVNQASAKRTKNSLKRERLRNIVQKVLTGRKVPESSNMTSEENEGDTPDTLSYDNDAASEYSGFTAALEQAPPIPDSEGSFQSATYPLRDSNLLDTGTTLHICNDAEKFTELHSAPDSDGVFTGRTWIPIRQRGTRVLLLNMGKNVPPTKFTLRNVAYIPGYHTNLVSYWLLQKKRFWFNGWDKSLVIGPPSKYKIVCKLLVKYQQYILQFSPVPTSEGSFGVSSRNPKPVRDGTAEQWHLRTGHIGKTALEQLVHQVTGVRLKGLPLIKCTDCSQASGTQIISRRPPESKAKMPFQRVGVDLFFFNPAHNDHKIAEIFKCEFTGLISSVTMGYKSSSLEGIRNYEARIKRQYGLNISIYRLDREATLRKAFEAHCKAKGIIVERPPSYTKEPAGLQESGGHVIIEKARRMRIQAQFPEEWWPVILEAAVYLYNRTPREQNGWRTPLGMLNNWLKSQDKPFVGPIVPSLAHTFAYGCRAYPLLDQVRAGKKKLDFKLNPRAHIGYLMGYMSSNSWWIWVPALNKCILTRDVRFDESVFYNPQAEPMSGLSSENLPPSLRY